jgi:hypothetical protein
MKVTTKAFKNCWVIRPLGVGVVFVAVCLPVCGQSVNTSRPDWFNHETYIEPHTLPQRFAAFHKKSGARMSGLESSQVVLVGTITGSAGPRSAQIIVQSPGYLSYREGSSRALTFDGFDLKTKRGRLAQEDDGIAESLLAHNPDALLLQVAAGGSLRRLGVE